MKNSKKKKRKNEMNQILPVQSSRRRPDPAGTAWHAAHRRPRHTQRSPADAVRAPWRSPACGCHGARVPCSASFFPFFSFLFFSLRSFFLFVSLFIWVCRQGCAGLACCGCCDAHPLYLFLMLESILCSVHYTAFEHSRTTAGLDSASVFRHHHHHLLLLSD